MSINNTANLRAMLQLNLFKSTNSMNISALRLTTGLKINSMADGASSYVIASGIQQSIRGWQGVQESTQTGISLVNTAKSSLSGMKSVLNQLNNLADTASSNTLSTERRTELQKQADLLLTQLYNKKETSRFDGIKIFGDENSLNTITPGQPTIVTSQVVGTTQIVGTTTTVGTLTTITTQEVVGGGLINAVDKQTVSQLQAAGYTVITSAADFATKIQGNLGGKFALAADIDFSGVSYYAINLGRTGELNGNGFAIKNLTMNNQNAISQGLFDTLEGASVVKNLILENFQISGTNTSVGALASETMASVVIDNVAIIGGSINGGNSTSGTGGLVGKLGGSSVIKNSYSTATVEGFGYIGGLVGVTRYNSTIQNSYATGNVTISGDFAGGLVGRNEGAISESWASGNVNGKSRIGGLVGEGVATITNSCATGAVKAGNDSGGCSYAGGLVGNLLVSYEDSVSNSYATGAVTAAGSYVGGLIGSLSNQAGTILSSYATGAVKAGEDLDGNSYAGGLVGYAVGQITNSYATGSVTATGNIVGGFIGYGQSLISNSYATGKVSIIIEQLKFKESSKSRMISQSDGLEQFNTTGVTTFDTTRVTTSPEGPQIPPITTKFTTTTRGDLDISTTLVQITSFVHDVGGFGGVATVRNSYATGDVTLDSNVSGSSIGGFVGSVRGHYSISDSYATGNVDTIDATEVGGFIGNLLDNGRISNSYSLGTVRGASNVGGFVGSNSGMIRNSYTKSAVTSFIVIGIDETQKNIGGFAGYNCSSIESSWSSGNVLTGHPNAGGFVGMVTGTADILNSFSRGSSNNQAGFAGTIESGANIASSYYNNAAPMAVQNGSTTGITGLSITTLENINSREVNNDLYNPTIQKVTDDVITGENTIAITSVTQFLNLVISSTIGENKTFVLMADLDFSGYSFNEIVSFSGTLDGNGHTIKNISTGRSLFTEIVSTGVVKDLVLDNIKITGDVKRGTLAGANSGTISNVTVKKVDINTGGSTTGSQIGGLVGYNGTGGSISMCQVKLGTIKLNAQANYVGGLVGDNYGTIDKSSSGVDIQGTSGSCIGGLIGWSNGKITSSSSSGNINVSTASAVGGLVGYSSEGTINNSRSYTSVNVSGVSSDIGGLLGSGFGTEITFSSFSGDVNAAGSTNVGGLIGIADSDSIIQNNGVSGAITGANNVGGLIGYSNNVYGLSNNYARAGTVTGASAVGGLIGRATNSAINKSYSEMIVDVQSRAGNSTGGYVGILDNSSVTNSYSTGSVVGNGAVGGFVGTISGTSSISKSYSTGWVYGLAAAGGFAGSTEGFATMTDNFWNTETSEKNNSCGTRGSTGLIIVTGLTTAQMADSTSFSNAGWDIKNADSIWGMSNGLPTFRDFSAGCTLPNLPSRWNVPSDTFTAANAGLSSDITTSINLGSTPTAGTTTTNITTVTAQTTIKTVTTEKLTTTQEVRETISDATINDIKNVNQYSTFYTAYAEGSNLEMSINTGMTFGKIYFDLGSEKTAGYSKEVISSITDKVNSKERSMNNYLDSLNYSVQSQRTNIQNLNEQYDYTAKANIDDEKVNYTKKQIVVQNISSIMMQSAKMRYAPIMTLLGIW